MATGDITKTQNALAAHTPLAIGKVATDISEACNVVCGFHPSMVILFLVDAGATANTMMIWTKSMAAGQYALISDGGDLTYPASLGVTAYTGATGLGFTIPAGQTGAADDDVIHYVAFR